MTGKKPGTTMSLTGSSITYGVTLIDKAPNPEAATAFLAYLLSAEGGAAVLKSQGQPPFVPARVPDAATRAKLPDALQALVEVKN